MIISVDDVKNVYKLYLNDSDVVIKNKLDGIESLIRSYTNNNFQNRNIRIICSSLNGKLQGSSTYFKVGDTLQITNSKINDGLYVIDDIVDNVIILDKELYDCESQMVTKVEYPPVIVSTVVNILKWDSQYADKMGVQSETIGRHSVSYFSQNENNSIGGYPKHLFNPLNQFLKASRKFL